MKILITIPHYYRASNNGYGSGGKDPQPRIEALRACLFNIFTLFAQSQCMIDIAQRKAITANNNYANEVDVIVCTDGENHLLDNVSIPEQFYTHRKCSVDNPMNLGFECSYVLKENLGKYDYYCFMEDDLLINDPYFFEKLNWFNKENDFMRLLNPNRYEVSTTGAVLKAYVDGDIRSDLTEKFQNINESSHLQGNFLGKNIVFQRPLNPHSGCYFLTQKQMEHWANQPYFTDKDTSFISPLESSASLGIMKTFKVYKPAPTNANFLEIQHYGDQFLQLIKA